VTNDYRRQPLVFKQVKTFLAPRYLTASPQTPCLDPPLNDWKCVISRGSGAVRILRSVHGVTLRDEVHSCEIAKTLNIVRLLDGYCLRWFGHVIWMPQIVIGEESLSGYTHRKRQPRGRSRTLHPQPGLVPFQCGCGRTIMQWLLKNVGYSQSSQPRSPALATHPRGKTGVKMREKWYLSGIQVFVYLLCYDSFCMR